MISFNTAALSATTITLTREAPKSGPGFDGLDQDGDGGVSYDEFRAAAEAVRYGGTLTITSSMAQSSISALSIGGGDLVEDLRGVDAGFDAAKEFERAMAAISQFASDDDADAAVEDAPREDTETVQTADPERAEAERLRAEALALISREVTREDIEAYTGGLSSFDPYERATQDIFELADADGDGSMNEAEFLRMQDALYGGGRSLGASTLTVTAIEGYATSINSGGASAASFSMLSVAQSKTSI